MAIFTCSKDFKSVLFNFKIIIIMAVRYVFFSKIEFSNAGGVQSQPECYILPNFVVTGPEPLCRNADFF